MLTKLTRRYRLGAEELEFYRERVQLLGKVGTGVGAFAVVAQIALAYGVPGYAAPWAPSTVLVFLALVGPAVAWRTCNSPEVTDAMVAAAEVGAVFTSTICYCGVLLWLNPQHHFERLLILALTLIAVLRSMLVPSSAQKTGVITAAMGIPLAVATAFYYRGHVPAGDALSATHTALTMTVWSLIWWTGTVAVCTAAAHILFGLRSEIRAAKRFGQYTLEERIGSGAMGEIYRASHSLMKRPTAIKIVPPEIAARSTLQRFEQEVQLTARLTHPNTITIYDYGCTPAGVLYYAMELLDGATLEDVMQVSGPQPPDRVVHVLEGTLLALREAHLAGLIHRDMKATNVMLCYYGGEADFVKVLDFGLAHLRDESPSTWLGTPLYLSPESIEHPENVSTAHDIYAVGVLAYYLLTNTHPFIGNSLEELCEAHLSRDPPPLSTHVTTSMPEGLESWVRRLLSRNADLRPDAATALAELEALDLERWTQSDASTWWDAFGPYVEKRKAARRGRATRRALIPG